MAAPVIPADPDEIQWANHVFDEWKYRHDAFWKSLYRALSAIAVITAIPFVKADFLQPLSGNRVRTIVCSRFMRAGYVAVPFIIFVALCGVLWQENQKLMRVESDLDRIRGVHVGTMRDEFQARRQRNVARAFVAIGLILWLFWAYVVIWQL